jgi:LysM repeat protein
MLCRVERNENGQPSKVLDQQGNESTLFKQIASVPHLKSTETALEVYRQTLADKFQKAKAPKSLLEVMDQLKRTGLAKNVSLISSTAIISKLKEIGISSELAKQIIAYHGNSRGIKKLDNTFTTDRFGEILSGTYFGKEAIAVAFSGVSEFSGNDNAVVFRSKIEESDFYEIDMQKATPSGDIGLLDIIGQEEWDKIKALKDSGQIKGLVLKNTREFVGGETGPSTQYVVYDMTTVETIKEYRAGQVRSLLPISMMFQKLGVTLTPQGFVYQGEVFINQEAVDPINTAIHEFGHLHLNWAKENKTEHYNEGLELAKTAEAKPYRDFVDRNQPELEKDSEAYLNEVLAQAIGDNGAKLNEQSKLKTWLNNLFADLKKLLGMAPTATINEFAMKTAAELMAGKKLGEAVESNDTTIQNQVLNTEQSLQFKTEEGTFDNYKDALSSVEDSDIEIGIENNEGQFENLITVSGRKDTDTESGVINHVIHENFVSGKMKLLNGELYFDIMGQDRLEQAINEEFAAETIVLTLGKIRVEQKNGYLRILPKKTQDSSIGKYTKAIFNAIASFTDSELLQQEEAIDESDLRLKLVSLLNDMGVSVMTIRQYQDQYKKKNGEDPGVNALADIANRVVAFRDGQIPIDQLTEETVSFIVESYTQEELESLFEGIENTAEYKEHYATYLEVYNSETEAKKEVLDRIMTNVILGRLEGKPQSLIARIIDAIESFFAKLTRTPSESAMLEKINEDVETIVFNKSRGVNTENFETSNSIRYNYTGYQREISSATNTIRNILQNVGESTRGLATYRKQLDAIDMSIEQLTELEQLESIAKLVATADQVTTTLKNAMLKVNREGKLLSPQNEQMYNALQDKTGMRAALSTFKEVLQRAINENKIPTGVTQGSIKMLMNKITDVNTEISDLSGIHGQASNEIIKRLVAGVKEQMPKREQEKYGEYIDDIINEAVRAPLKDINVAFKFFGQLTDASNPLAGLLSQTIYSMTLAHTQEASENMQPIFDLYDQLKKKGVTDKQLADLFEGGYMVGETDQKKFSEALINVDYEAFKAEMGITFGIEEYKEKRRNRELPETSAKQQGEIAKRTSELRESITEQSMAKDYYDKMKKKHLKIDISGQTINFLKEISAQRGDYNRESMQPAKTVKVAAGETLIDIALKYNISLATLESYNKALSSTLKQGDTVILKPSVVVYSKEVEALKRSLVNMRRENKNMISELGILKRGITASDTKPGVPEKNYVEKDDRYYVIDKANASDEAIIAFELNKMDALFQEEQKNQTSSQRNINQRLLEAHLSGMTKEELLEFFKANVTVAFSDAFYSTIEGGSFMKDQAFLEANDTDEAKVNITLLKDAYRNRAAIIAKYRETLSPAEVGEMSQSDRLAVADYTNTIDAVIEQLKFPQKEIIEGEENQGTKVPEGQKAPNNAYFFATKSMTQQEKLNFLDKHIRSSRRGSFIKAQTSIKTGIPLGKKAQARLDSFPGTTEMERLISYGESLMHPYYLRYAPAGYKSFEQQTEGQINVTQVLQTYTRILTDPMYDVRMHHSFEQNQEERNPDYNDNYEGGVFQPKKGEYESQKFKDMFAVDRNTGLPTRNLDLWSFREAYLDLQRKNLNSYGVTGQHNLFKQIQLSRTQMNKIVDLATSKDKLTTLKEMVKDGFTNRVDDKIFGEKNQQGQLVIPKYYLQDLENESDVTDDVMFALSKMTQRASEYKHKNATYSDVQSIMNKMLTLGTIGKTEAEKSRIYKMMKGQIEYNYFGVTELKSFLVKVPLTDHMVDLAPVARRISSFFSVKNLGFNLHVPLTGAITGVIAKKMEVIIGEDMNPESHKMAMVKVRELLQEFVSKGFEVNDNSELNLILRSFGFSDMSERAMNAKYGKLLRTAPKVAMGLNTVANIPVIPPIVLSVLFDNKIIDGKIQTKREYLSENQSDPLASEKWKALKEEALFNYIDFSKGSSVLTKEGRDLLTNVSDVDTYFKNRLVKMKATMRDLSGRADGQIPQEFRVEAQREMFGQFVMMHKSYLSIGLSKRFKDKQFNPLLGKIEEGSYRTLYSFAESMIKGATQKNLSAAYKEFLNPTKDVLDQNGNIVSVELDGLEKELRQRNLRRVAIEMAVASTMGVMATLLMGVAMDDDNKDNYALQFTNYFLYRVASETSSVQFGILGEASDVVEAPVVMYDNAKEMAQFWKLFSGEEIKTGKYKGQREFERQFMKTIPGYKGAFDIYSAENLRTTARIYKRYNGDKMNYSTLMLTALMEEALKEDEEN